VETRVPHLTGVIMSKRVTNLPEQPKRWLCEECGAVHGDNLLEANNPFDESETITGCPTCRAVNSFVAACWKCDRPATSGTPLIEQYRYVNACYKHRPDDAIHYRKAIKRPGNPYAE
jgi:hypothetical protein